MKTAFEGDYHFGKASFCFDDETFGGAFARAYSLQRASSDAKADYIFSIEALPSDSVLIKTPLREKVVEHDDPQIAGIIDYDLDELIRSAASDDLLSLHASSAVIGDSTLLFLGISGRGKTTLGIEAARHCDGSLGDEYAFAEPKTGKVFFESYPFQIKNSIKGFTIKLEGVDAYSHAFTAEELNLQKLSGKKPIKALILPNRRKKQMKPSLEPVPACLLHKELMPSVLGSKDRAKTFRSLTSMLSTFGIEVFSLHYSEAHEAAAFLKDAAESNLI